jgi:hypothetical protein
MPENKHISKWVAFATVAVPSYSGLIPLGYKLGPYWLNHWIAWSSFGFIIIYVPILVFLLTYSTLSAPLFQRVFFQKFAG